MAETTFHTSLVGRNPGGFRGFVVSVFNGLVAISDANRRVRQVEALQALNEAQLAELGLRREDIVRHVFRDAFYL